MQGGDILFLTLMAVLVCGGLTAASQPDGLLGPVREWLDLRVRSGFLSKYIAKPLLLCETCMASIWGSLTYWTITLVSHHRPCFPALFFWWPFVILATAFINHVLWTIVHTLAAIRDHHQCPPSQRSGSASGTSSSAL